MGAPHVKIIPYGQIFFSGSHFRRMIGHMGGEGVYDIHMWHSIGIGWLKIVGWTIGFVPI